MLSQENLELLYDKNQQYCKVRNYFACEFPNGEEEEIKFLAALGIHKRCDVSTMVGIMYFNFNEIKDTLIFLEDMINRGACIFENEQFIVLFDTPKSLDEEISLYQFPLPMIQKPEILIDNEDTGYLTQKRNIVLNQSSKSDVNLDHINRINSVELEINPVMNEYINTHWKENYIHPFAKKQFKKYKKNMYKMNCDYVDEGKFYLTHSYDKRGRTYANGYYINYQGRDANKAVIQLKNKELCL